MQRLLLSLSFLATPLYQLAAQRLDSVPPEHFTAFGLRLLPAIAATNASPNTFISPLSAGLAYAALLPGARGQTREEIRATLGITSSSDEVIGNQLRQLQDRLTTSAAVTLHIGTSLWVQNDLPLRPEYRKAVDQGFAAPVQQVDFASPHVVDQVNAWVNHATEGRISSILRRPPDQVVLMLLNAVYFKGDWLNKFDSLLTKPDTFTRRDRSRVIVPFMQNRLNLHYWATDTLQGLLLPYRGSQLSALLILPAETLPLSSLLSSLSPARLRAWQRLPYFTDIILRLPRLELRGDFDLKAPLMSLGLGHAFDSRAADFGRLSSKPLFISESRQVTYLKVNEEGTEAVAVTSNSLQIRSVPPPPIQITLNRPFLFGILENASGELLFIGVIGDPSAKPD